MDRRALLESPRGNRAPGLFEEGRVLCGGVDQDVRIEEDHGSRVKAFRESRSGLGVPWVCVAVVLRCDIPLRSCNAALLSGDAGRAGCGSARLARTGVDGSWDARRAR
jgi:hypothetical protein